jgi:hypothetical protein
MLAEGMSIVRLASLVLATALSCVDGAYAKQPKDLTPELKQVRDALDKYRDPVVAIHDGYFSTLGCVTYPKAGAAGQVPYPRGGMGVHFVNVGLLGKPLDPLKPQILVYEPVGDKLHLVAAEWFVPLSSDVKERPKLFGRPFDGPMEGHHPLMPLALHHYDLHVWLWKANPAGMFAPTNPSVRCPKGAAYTLEEVSPRTEQLRPLLDVRLCSSCTSVR